MSEWFAWGLVESYRLIFPDLTQAEEDLIFEYALSDDPKKCLFLRCTFSDGGKYVCL